MFRKAKVNNARRRFSDVQKLRPTEIFRLGFFFLVGKQLWKPQEKQTVLHALKMEQNQGGFFFR